MAKLKKQENMNMRKKINYILIVGAKYNYINYMWNEMFLCSFNNMCLLESEKVNIYIQVTDKNSNTMSTPRLLSLQLPFQNIYR